MNVGSGPSSINSDEDRGFPVADHTETSGTGIRPYRSHFGSFPIQGFGEDVNSTFKAGDLVAQGTSTSSHRIVTASSNSSLYMGVAGDAASSVTDNNIPVYLARPGVEFIGWAKETISSTMVGEYRQFARDTSKAIDYLSAATTNARARITRVGLQDVAGGPYDIGDTNGYVAFEFVADWTAFGPKTPPAQS